jgi:hypothetical protein
MDIIDGISWDEELRQKAEEKGGWKSMAEQIQDPREASRLLDVLDCCGANDTDQVQVVLALSRPENKNNFSSIDWELERGSRELIDRLIKNTNYPQLAVFASAPRAEKDKEKLLGMLLERHQTCLSKDAFSKPISNEAHQAEMLPIISGLAEQVDLKHRFRSVRLDVLEPLFVSQILSDSIFDYRSFKEVLDGFDIPIPKKASPYEGVSFGQRLLHPFKARRGELGKEVAAEVQSAEK